MQGKEYHDWVILNPPFRSSKKNFDGVLHRQLAWQTMKIGLSAMRVRTVGPSVRVAHPGFLDTRFSSGGGKGFEVARLRTRPTAPGIEKAVALDYHFGAGGNGGAQ